jgi:hypothetical protein
VTDRRRLTDRPGAVLKTYLGTCASLPHAIFSLCLADPSGRARGPASRAERRRLYDRHRRLSAQEREDLDRQTDQAQPPTRDQALVEASALMAQGWPSD